MIFGERRLRADPTMTVSLGVRWVLSREYFQFNFILLHYFFHWIYIVVWKVQAILFFESFSKSCNLNLLCFLWDWVILISCRVIENCGYFEWILNVQHDYIDILYDNCELNFNAEWSKSKSLTWIRRICNKGFFRLNFVHMLELKDCTSLVALRNLAFCFLLNKSLQFKIFGQS